MIIVETSGHFYPGRLVATPGILEIVPYEELLNAYSRHLRCDWGELSDQDKQMNDLAVRSGERLLSAYQSSKGVKFWIITEADRSCTTFLLPEEY